MPSTLSRFDNINDELEYYKNHAEDLEQELAETKFALEEFQLSSKELEEELEKEIDSTEKRYNEIKIRNESMRQEVEDWKEKYHQAMKDSNVNINQLTRQLEELRQQTENFIRKERELEQDNDDLERTGRAAQWSLQELERKYNVALEKQAMMENEVAAKATLAEEVQRLKDELRDANVELAVMKSNQSATNASTGSLNSYSGSTSSLAGRKSPLPAIGSHEAMPSIRARLAKSGASHRSASTVRTAAGGATGTAGFSTPHQNPVLMVQEMVGRVKSLEARLVSCRSLVTPLLQPPPSYSTSIPTSGRSSSQSGSRPGSPSKTALSSPKGSKRSSLMQHHQRSMNGSITS
ncbi:NADH:ubiquinone oxidoreductase [Haplosporangium sp. Z 767]|nr:NADH:ubiquinone oxidoreductase [Haplosporangium sp. Z 767]KAF9190836.1 NADH:ubiquinone oxidoreductase [Haplosporangium sp. Z 11]